MHFNHLACFLLFLILGSCFSENPSQALIVETRDRGAEKVFKPQNAEVLLTIPTHVQAGLCARRVSKLTNGHFFCSYMNLKLS